MDYYGIGFSNIRLPNEEKSYIYKYKTYQCNLGWVELNLKFVM